MFHVGQKIQCARTEEMMSAVGLTMRVFSTRLVLNRVYQIEQIVRSPVPGLPLSLVLVELPPVQRSGDNTPSGFPSTWFRPLTERKTDISALEALLVGKSVTEDA